jgi:2-methylcitrate dehydratase
MRLHEVRVWPPDAARPRERQLAWRIAEVAAERVPPDQAVTDMVTNRMIDVAGVALAAVDRHPVASARAQALAHPRAGGATVCGMPSAQPVACQWAAWANGAAVRELDFHDNFFAVESAHPGDTIAPILAVAQQCGASGEDLVGAIATAYEIQIDLCKAIGLAVHGMDHVVHLGPAVAAGIGNLLRLSAPVIYQAVQHAAHVSLAVRQARRGQISSWKAHAPAHVGKLAIEAIDRAMRGETGPSPIYEGAYGIIARTLGGPDAVYQVPLPEPGEQRAAILETFTKEHSAGYHGQALIDLAFRMRGRILEVIGDNWDTIERIVLHTKRIGHLVMGSGSGDPEKYDPVASRETLDHSAMFIFAVALQDGEWHHERSYAPLRVRRPDTVRLWQKVRTVEDPEWNRRYDEPPPLGKDHGARAVITLVGGARLIEEIAVADAHPRGARPFGRSEYVGKFETLLESVVEPAERARFLELVQRLPDLAPDELRSLTVEVQPSRRGDLDHRGIF